MSLLTSINTWSRRRWTETATPEADIDDERQTIVHVTLDAGHAALLRQALSRDCTGDEWTMRIASMRDSDRVRLSLYLPKQRVHQAVSHIEHHVPSAKVDQIVEIPEALTDAWRDLAHLEADKTKARWHATHRKPDASAGRAVSVRELLDKEHIVLNVDLADRDALFRWAAQRMASSCSVDAEAIVTGLNEREQSASTALGHGFAIPHCRLEHLDRFVALYVRAAQSFDLAMLDGHPVVDAVILLVPGWATSAHLALLAEIAQLFCDPGFRDRLRASTTVDAVHACFESVPESSRAMPA